MQKVPCGWIGAVVLAEGAASVTLHRIVTVDRGRIVTRGDNAAFPDPSFMQHILGTIYFGRSVNRFLPVHLMPLEAMDVKDIVVVITRYDFPVPQRWGNWLDNVHIIMRNQR